LGSLVLANTRTFVRELIDERVRESLTAMADARGTA
jgi:hypothetical protein